MSTDQKNMLSQLLENNKRNNGTRIQNRVYKMQSGDTAAKIGKTGITCLEVLFEGENEMTEQRVHELVHEHADKFASSRQKPWKIFQYYRKQLIDAGFLVVEKVA